MYLEYFNLRQSPFSLTPNTEFLVKLKSHQECINLLNVTLAQGEGFVKIVGEVGTGKTLICRQLMNGLSTDKYHLAYIPNPQFSASELRGAVARELGLPSLRDAKEHEVMEMIYARLVSIAKEGKQVILLVDEAQAMQAEAMEALRLLTNLETEQRKLLQVVLFGQPELDEQLAGRELRQLRQRITFSYHLQPVVAGNIGQYINQRLSVAGYSGEALFSPGALKYIFKASEGIPRLINILCNKSLMAAYGKGDKRITKLHVKRAIKDTEEAKRPSEVSWPMIALFAGVSSIAFLMGMLRELL